MESDFKTEPQTFPQVFNPRFRGRIPQIPHVGCGWRRDAPKHVLPQNLEPRFGDTGR